MKSLLKIKKTILNDSLKLNEISNIKNFIKTIKKDQKLLFEYQVIDNILSTSFDNIDNAKSFINENIKYLSENKNRDIYLNTYNINTNIKLSEKEIILEELISLKLKKDTPKRSKQINEIITKLSKLLCVNENSVVVNNINELDNVDINLFVKTFKQKIDEKYSNLTENENALLTCIITNDENIELYFNNIKTDIINELKNNKDIDIDLLNEVINKIDKIIFNEETYITDLTELYDLIS